MKFANWWNDRLQLYCYDDIPKGIFTDQRWCDLAPAYFDVLILKDPGYNMAPWNLSHRKVMKKNGKYFVNNNYELVFFHYSGFDSGANEEVFNYYVPDKKNIIYKLRNEYIEEMNNNGQAELGKHRWSYDFYNDGNKIDRNVRIAYRNQKYFNKIDVNPFDLSNEHFEKLLGLVPIPEFKIPSLPRRIFRRIVPLKIRKILKKI